MVINFNIYYTFKELEKKITGQKNDLKQWVTLVGTPYTSAETDLIMPALIAASRVTFVITDVSSEFYSKHLFSNINYSQSLSIEDDFSSNTIDDLLNFIKLLPSIKKLELHGVPLDKFSTEELIRVFSALPQSIEHLVVDGTYLSAINQIKSSSINELTLLYSQKRYSQLITELVNLPHFIKKLNFSQLMSHIKELLAAIPTHVHHLGVVWQSKRADICYRFEMISMIISHLPAFIEGLYLQDVSTEDFTPEEVTVMGRSIPHHISRLSFSFFDSFTYEKSLIFLNEIKSKFNLDTLQLWPLVLNKEQESNVAIVFATVFRNVPPSIKNLYLNWDLKLLSIHCEALKNTLPHIKTLYLDYFDAYELTVSDIGICKIFPGVTNLILLDSQGYPVPISKCPEQAQNCLKEFKSLISPLSSSPMSFYRPYKIIPAKELLNVNFGHG